MKLARLLLVAGLSVVSQGAGAAVMTTSPFGDIDKVAEDLAQEFYRAWRLRISELPGNYQQIATASGVQYRAPNLQGCTKTNSYSLFQPVTEITVASKTGSGELTETVTYRGCKGDVLLTEIISVRGTNPQPTLVEDLLVGKRRFVHSADESLRRSTFVDPTLGPIIDVVSTAVDPKTSTNRIFVMGNPLVSIARRDQPTHRYARIDVEDFDVQYSKFGRFGKSGRSRSRGMKTHFVVVKEGDILSFKIGDEAEFTNQRRFEERYSSNVVQAVNYTATDILEMYLGQLPKTEVAKPSAGANQRILEELNLALTRVTSNTELERVRILLQEYLLLIQSGDIVIDDRRPK